MKFGTAAALVVCWATLSCTSTAPKTEPSVEQAVEVASRKATELGYDLSTMQVEADDENRAWEDYSADLSSGYAGLHAGLGDRLARGKYWAVYFGPRESKLGGDLWVFVSRSDLTVLDVVRGR